MLAKLLRLGLTDVRLGAVKGPACRNLQDPGSTLSWQVRPRLQRFEIR